MIFNNKIKIMLYFRDDIICSFRNYSNRREKYEHCE